MNLLCICYLFATHLYKIVVQIGNYDEQRIRITFNIELISHETEIVVFMRGLPVIYASYNCVYKYIHI